MKDFIKKSRRIYDKLQDQLSRDIFINRTLYNITAEPKYIRNIVETAPHGKIFLEQLNEAIKLGKNICIFGAGIWGLNIKNSYPDINFLCFIDNAKYGTNIDGGGYLSLVWMIGKSIILTQPLLFLQNYFIKRYMIS